GVREVVGAPAVVADSHEDAVDLPATPGTPRPAAAHPPARAGVRRTRGGVRRPGRGIGRWPGGVGDGEVAAPAVARGELVAPAFARAVAGGDHPVAPRLAHGHLYLAAV